MAAWPSYRYDAYRLSDGNIILLRNLGPMVGIWDRPFPVKLFSPW
jgi:hypothetical protein